MMPSSGSKPAIEPGRVVQGHHYPCFLLRFSQVFHPLSGKEPITAARCDEQGGIVGMQTFSPADFVKALSTDTLKRPVILTGMVKKAEQLDALLFSPANSCLAWVSIPLEMIEKVEWLGKAPCKDHTHDLVNLVLKETDKGEASFFADLLRAYTSQQNMPRLAEAVSQPGTLPVSSPGHGGPSDVTPLTAAQTTYQVCYYDPNGQYAGYWYSTDQWTLRRSCKNFIELHPGAYCGPILYFYTRCPQ